MMQERLTDNPSGATVTVMNCPGEVIERECPARRLDHPERLDRRRFFKDLGDAERSRPRIRFGRRDLDVYGDRRRYARIRRVLLRREAVGSAMSPRPANLFTRASARLILWKYIQIIAAENVVGVSIVTQWSQFNPKKP